MQLNKYEQFVCVYLRLNGYFTVPNFIVHDPKQVLNDTIGNRTETDVLAIRMPYSVEQTNTFQLRNDPCLVGEQEGRIDVVIAEAKSGDQNKPNKVWRRQESVDVIEYLVRFIGLFKDNKINEVAQQLLTQYRFKDKSCRIRYIIFASGPNEHYQQKGIQYITHDCIARFLVGVRGNCWVDEDIGVASVHQQWDPFLKDIFGIANNQDNSPEVRISEILEHLAK